MAYRYENLKLGPNNVSQGATVGTVDTVDDFEDRMKRLGLVGADPVDKLFRVSEQPHLFSDFVHHYVKKGFESDNVLSSLIAAYTPTDKVDHRGTLVTHGSDVLEATIEGGEPPVTTMGMQANPIKLKKYSHMLMCTYETLRYQTIDLFALNIRQIGASIGRSLLPDICDVLVFGDGNSNAATVLNVATDGTLSYTDIRKLWVELSPYKMTTLIASTSAFNALVELPEMQTVIADAVFGGTGADCFTTSTGLTVIHSNKLASGAIVGLDKDYALEMACGNVTVEADAIIERQLSYCNISLIGGFSKINKDAAIVLNI